MGLNIDKIIMESISSVNDEQGAQAQAQEVTSQETVTEDTAPTSPADVLMWEAVTPAISAGLGALQLRNRIRTVTTPN